MQQMTHASATFTTTDDVCTALLTFVGSIAAGGHSESVAIPALRADGQVMEVRMTVNADSAFVVVPVDTDAQDEHALLAASASVVSELGRRSAASGQDAERR
ncbi:MULTISPECIES: hypothetical protein [unclassified Rathayibacter]|uniref:hypothetical protein n=1 Tax=unclassified Rathayibacter TaxID=2609250 RepID=UPI000F4BC7B5|nr:MULTISPECIES: hypothetical protein [unclassified Rathayibacter]ROP44387.1 hypothetical protein EDF45_3853 [Rathayibacter sp. PhB186]ROS46945.1 hypothetical protein EDF44_3846 [Rathayibacter sp. PhB185]